MKRKHLIFLSPFLLFFLLIGCTKDEDTLKEYDYLAPSISLQTRESPYVQASQDSLIFGPTGGEQTVKVSANCDWRVFVYTYDEWLWVSTDKKTGTLTVTAERLMATSVSFQRGTTISIYRGDISNKMAQIEVLQTRGNPYIKVNTTELTFGPMGGEQTIEVTANCRWAVSERSLNWIEVSKKYTDYYYTSDGTITISLAENTSSIRTTQIEVYSPEYSSVERAVINITQKGY